MNKFGWKYISSTSLIVAIAISAVQAQTTTSSPTGRSVTKRGRQIVPNRDAAKERAAQPKWSASSTKEDAIQTGTSIPDEEGELRKLFERAKTQIDAGKLEEALVILREAEKLRPKSYDVQFNLGVVLARLKRFPEAASAFAKAVAYDPEDAKAHGYLCRALAESGKSIEAIDECREAIRLDPNETKFRAYLAEIYTHDGRSGEALQLLEAAVEKNQNDLIFMGTLGDAYFDNGDYFGAAAIYERIAGRWPSMTLTYLRLSCVYTYLDRPNEAITAARKYVELEPGSAKGQINLGEKLRDAGFFDESIEPFVKATSMDPNSGRAYLGLSDSYEAIGDKDNTLTSLRKAYRLLPADFTISYRLGYALTGYGKMAEAVEPLERANSLKRDDVPAMIALGLAYFESHQFDKAIEVLTRADQLRPNNKTIEMFLRVSKGRKQILGDFDNILQAVKEDPSDTHARNYLGNAYRYRNMLKEAEQEYITITKLAPNDYKGFSYLAIFYSDTGQIEKSIEPHQRAAELSKSPVPYLSLASNFEKLGRLDEAIAMAKRAVEIKPTLLESRLDLGDLLLKTGKRSEALREFQTAFELASGDARPNFRLAWFYIRTGNKEGALRHYAILKDILPNELQNLERSLQAHFGRLP